jgi:chemotaxis-related protein WspD
VSLGDLPDSNAPSSAAPGLQTNVEIEVSGCWSNYGVYGDGSCVELHKFVHCRNCPVYSAAGVRLIDQPLPPNYRQEWTQHFAQEKRLPEAGNASAILFRIQNEWLALPTHSFQEVAEKRPIHSLPHRREGTVLGLANIRGELVICISVGHLLKIESMPSLHALRENYRRLLVVNCEPSRLAFPVDEVHGPHRFHPQELQPPPSTVVRANHRYAQGVLQWQNRTVGLLDVEVLLSSLHQSLA